MALNKIAARRLTKLANFLEDEVKPKQFNLQWWSSECGTVFCAVGWAAHSPKFRGLSMHLSPTISCIMCDRTFGTNWYGVVDYFHLHGNSDALFLFSPQSYPQHRSGIKSVINRIRKYVASDGTYDISKVIRA